MSSSSDSSAESKMANLYFMASNEGSNSDSVSVFSTDFESYDHCYLHFIKHMRRKIGFLLLVTS